MNFSGLRIGELSLGNNFDGVLPWGLIDNRPFLRCMHGYGLCLWRLVRFDEAKRIFDRVLWLNPSDNQGYVLRVEGTIGDEFACLCRDRHGRQGEYQIAVGKAAQAKHCFRADMEASGQAVPVPDPRLETAGFYKASGLKIPKDAEGEPLPVRRFMACRLTWKHTAAEDIVVQTPGLL